MAVTSLTNCENCIKSITGSKTQSGITLNIVGRFDPIPPSLKIGNHELKLKAVNKVSHLLFSLTYTTDFLYKVTGAARFKVIPKSVYDALAKYDQLSKLTSELSPVSSPAKIFLKIADSEDDIFAQNSGFTPDEIFQAFGLTVIYPPFLRYRITELYINDGISVASLIHTIFPIPSTLNFIDKDVVEVSVALPSISISMPTIFKTESLEVIETETMNFTHIGMNSEPKNIVSDFDSAFDTDEVVTFDESGNPIKLEILRNKLGKAYGVVSESYVIEKVDIPDFTALEKYVES